MTLLDILNPWAALIEARQIAENCVMSNQRLRGALCEMQAAADGFRIERDVAWAKLARRSAGISAGNRTRSLRRRGALLPAGITESTGNRADQRTEHTG